MTFNITQTKYFLKDYDTHYSLTLQPLINDPFWSTRTPQATFLSTIDRGVWYIRVKLGKALWKTPLKILYSPGHWSYILEGQYIADYSHAKQTNDNLWRNIRSAGVPHWHFCNSHEHIYFFLGWFQRLLHPEMGTLSNGHGPLLVHSSKLLPLIMALEILYTWDRD